MDIYKYFSDKREDIISKWKKAVFDTYPKGSGKFFIGVRNQFDNPIGFVVSDELPRIYDELTGNNDEEILRPSIENIIKIRAVQDFTISEAVGFLNILKQIFWDEIVQNLDDTELLRHYMDFESRIDGATCIAFELYHGMRVKLERIKVDEVKRRNEKMMERLFRK
jgi:hypothetical protein